MGFCNKRRNKFTYYATEKYIFNADYKRTKQIENPMQKLTT